MNLHITDLKAYLEKHRIALESSPDAIGITMYDRISDCILDLEFAVEEEEARKIENRAIMDQIVFTARGDLI